MCVLLCVVVLKAKPGRVTVWPPLSGVHWSRLQWARVRPTAPPCMEMLALWTTWVRLELQMSIRGCFALWVIWVCLPCKARRGHMSDPSHCMKLGGVEARNSLYPPLQSGSRFYPFPGFSTTLKELKWTDGTGMIFQGEMVWTKQLIFIEVLWVFKCQRGHSYIFHSVGLERDRL